MSATICRHWERNFCHWVMISVDLSKVDEILSGSVLQRGPCFSLGSQLGPLWRFTVAHRVSFQQALINTILGCGDMERRYRACSSCHCEAYTDFNGLGALGIESTSLMGFHLSASSHSMAPQTVPTIWRCSILMHCRQQSCIKVNAFMLHSYYPASLILSNNPYGLHLLMHLNSHLEQSTRRLQAPERNECHAAAGAHPGCSEGRLHCRPHWQPASHMISSH